MLGQNVIVYPDLDMVIVTCAGNNELFQNNVMLDLIRDAFPQEYQASEYALPENPAEYHKTDTPGSLTFPMDPPACRRSDAAAGQRKADIPEAMQYIPNMSGC